MAFSIAAIPCSSFIMEIEGRGSGLGLGWERPRLPKRRGRPGTKEVSAGGAMRPGSRKSLTDCRSEKSRQAIFLIYGVWLFSWFLQQRHCGDVSPFISLEINQ